MEAERSGGLLAWQWSLYSAGHRTRANLLIHALTVPLFWVGNLNLIAGLLTASLPAMIVGLFLAPLAVAAQGRGHRLEPVAPMPFRGPGDVLARLFVEQWITFPRYVLSGGWLRAWREAPRVA